MDTKIDLAEHQPLKRFAFILRLREDAAEAYDWAHREVWPEMLAMLKR
jgi:L-rhamnose mutarotase